MESTVIDPADIKERGIVVVSFDNGGRVLPIREGSTEARYLKFAGQWSVPMGHIEPGENEVECAAREYLEETGGRLKNLVQVGEITFEDANGSYIQLSIFFGEVDPSHQPPESEVVRWTDIEDLAHMELNSQLRFPTKAAVDMAMKHVQVSVLQA